MDSEMSAGSGRLYRMRCTVASGERGQSIHGPAWTSKQSSAPRRNSAHGPPASLRSSAPWTSARPASKRPETVGLVAAGTARSASCKQSPSKLGVRAKLPASLTLQVLLDAQLGTVVDALDTALGSSTSSSLSLSCTCEASAALAPKAAPPKIPGGGGSTRSSSEALAMALPAVQHAGCPRPSSANQFNGSAGAGDIARLARLTGCEVNRRRAGLRKCERGRGLRWSLGSYEA
mmetsp:Transcript_13012/g.38783  ORF Transcript_13012/g.38783 Transcript_13012/m.38783 type:complete len:233 (-) Transcript_13012:2-700(-)